MASRRSRIKGIANIPPRKKPPVDCNVSEEVSTRNAKEYLKASLNGILDSSEADNNHDPAKLSKDVLDEKAKLRKAQDVVHYDSFTTQPGPIPLHTETIHNSTSNLNLKEQDKSEDSITSTVQALNSSTLSCTQPAFNRRRLIKPVISLKAIQKSNIPPNNPPASEEPQRPSAEEPSPPENASYVSPPLKANSTNGNITNHALITDNCISKEVTALGITKLPLGNNCVEKLDEVARPPITSNSNKFINRARIKAVPRLGQRRTSFSIGSASESEDESKKSNRTYRIRNDSVCSSVSGTPASFEPPATLAETCSPRKKQEFNIVIQRKCRRTEQSRKLAEARRDFLQKFNNGKPDKQKLTMIDLIFYNPSSSPMSQKRRRKDTDGESIVSQTADDVDDAPALEEQVETVDADAEESNEENNVPAPQITIGPNGKIVVDEKSLYIENKDVNRDRQLLLKSSLVDGDQFDAGYGVFKRAKRSQDWSRDETLRFYKALNTLGTDFTLMCEIFPGRSRRELKRKFKKEERINRALVDRAVMQPIQFDISELQRDLEKVELEKMRKEQLKKDLQEHKEQCKVEKENKKKNYSQAVHRAKWKNIRSKNDEPVAVPKEKSKSWINAKEGLKKKLQQGINSLIDSDDSDVEEVNNDNLQEIIENDMFLDSSKGINSSIIISKSCGDEGHFEDDTNNISEDIPKSTSTQSKTAKPNNVEVSVTECDINESLAEGSIVLSSAIDETGCETYAVYSVNQAGEKIPLDLSPKVLQLLLNNHDDESEPPIALKQMSKSITSNSKPDAIDINTSMPSAQIYPDLPTTSDDCVILSFDDTSSDNPIDSGTKIVAIDERATW